MAATDLLGEQGADHLLRRAGFGPRPGEVAAFAGKAREDAVASLIGQKGRKARPPSNRRNDFDAFRRMQGWWLQQMRSPKWRLHEKMTLFFHDHFASAYSKVNDQGWMSIQNGLFRELALGNFRELVRRVTRDPAMLRFLDGFQNEAENPNENYGRELMELFTLGREDLLGVPNYTQEDVRAAARACTGFTLLYKRNRRTDTVILDSDHFDSGTKTIFAGKPYEATGNIGVENADGVPFPPAINLIDILFTHTDSQGRPTVARFITKKLWEYFAYPSPDLALIDELADVFVASGYELAPLMRAILVHDEFYTQAAMSSSAKNPVEFATQIILQLQPKSSFENLSADLDRMGMDLFNPPSVNGWNNSDAWLATSRYRERFFLVQRIAAGRSKKNGGYVFKPDALLKDVAGAGSTPEVVDGLLARFGLQGLPAASRQALIDYLDSGQQLSDDDWVETKFRGVLVLILTLPEFQVH